MRPEDDEEEDVVTHTYTVTWEFQTEATGFIDAVDAFLHRVEVGKYDRAVGKPILTVRKFVDTDKPDEVCEVDTETWITKEIS